MVNMKKLIGSPGKDRLNGGSARDVVLGLDGNATLVGGAGSDALSGGIGVDSISYAGPNAAVSVSFASNKAFGGMAPKDAILGFENVLGSSYSDNIVRGRRVNVLNQDAGNDTIMGGAVFSNRTGQLRCVKMRRAPYRQIVLVDLRTASWDNIGCNPGR
jgi:Ca2+-binding RTX toxin-like protein